ncbi:hypothetical protein L2D00_02745 [Hyphomonadaceae bacterium BL14]|nr:hypothetical protein L2D00_02745 [Hyphomonadaceae bacterium BL14]
MTPRKSLGSKASNRQPPKSADVEAYDDEVSEPVVQSLRERFGERLKAAKPKSEASW